ncbi:MAG: CHAT domain-containing protein [Anaerolineae bacterium]|nr:CHAT domain-containing protein [Anaerolineae bacterium]
MWNREAIRELLNQAFSSEELKTLCFDTFPAVYEDLGSGMTKGQMIRHLLDYCLHEETMELLLERVKERRGAKYRRFEPQLRRVELQDALVVSDDTRPGGELFDLRIRVFGTKQDNAVYPTEALLGDGSQNQGEFRLDAEGLRAVELDPRRYGRRLFEALFHGDMRRAYDNASLLAQERAGGWLRLRLWIDRAAYELHALAWEQLHYPLHGAWQPVAISERMPFSRYVGLEAQEPPPIDERPLRMLAAVANPADLAHRGLERLDVAAEVEGLAAALGGLQQAGKLDVTWMPGQTGLPDELRARLARERFCFQDGPTSTANLIRALSAGEGYDILHFVGHGAFSRRDQQAVLFLEDEAGGTVPVQEAVMAGILASLQASPRLVFLAACASAAVGAGEEPFVGLAPRLVQVGIPAVVAMRKKIPIARAGELAGNFYTSLLEHGLVDRALNRARLMLYQSSGADWSTPVLYMRLKEGRLI